MFEWNWGRAPSRVEWRTIEDTGMGTLLTTLTYAGDRSATTMGHPCPATPT